MPEIRSLKFWIRVGIFTKIFLCLLLLYGCAEFRQGPGLKKTTEEPLHAESGIAATIWKIPIIGIGGWGLGDWGGYQAPSVIIHQYNYQAQPQPTSPGTPPLPPTSSLGPPPIDYQTIYRSAGDDPTLVIFSNQSYRTVRLQIDGQEPEIKLASYQATVDLHFTPGEHRVRQIIEKLTAVGILELVRFFNVNIRLEGRSQIFYIYDY